MITTEKIKIFNSYGGDIDGLARNSRSNDHNLITDNEWSLIDNFFQDIELINKGLAAQTSIYQTFIKLKANCDQNSFDLLTNKIIFYHDFKSVASILKQIENYIKTDTDTVWSRFDSSEQFLTELKQDIERIEFCDFSTLEKIRREFGPTSSYQEISISNGWSEEYLKLAETFDKLFEKLTEKKTAHNSTLPKAGHSWWKKLFSS